MERPLEDELITDIPTEDKETIVIGKSKYRWVALTGYFLLATTVTATTTFFIPVVVVLKNAYNVNQVLVQMTVVLPSILYPPSHLLLGAPLLERIGTKKTFYIGGILFAICLWIRLLINFNFSWAIIACIFSGVGSPLIFNAITMVTVAWFPTSERPFATTITSLYPAIGRTLGSILPVIYINASVTDAEPHEVRKNVFKSILLGGIVLSSFIIVGLLLFQERPKIPPSPESTQVVEGSGGKIWKDFKSLIMHRNFNLLNLNYVIILGITLITGSVISPILHPFTSNPTTISLCVITCIISGVFGAVIIGIFISKSRKFIVWLYVLQILTLLGFVMLFICMRYVNLTMTFVGMGLMGFFMLPLMALYFELATEVAYPIGAASIVGLMQSSIMIVSSGGALLVAHLLNDPSENKTGLYGIVGSGLILLNIFTTCFIKEDLRLTNSGLKLSVKSDDEDDTAGESYKEIATTDI